MFFVLIGRVRTAEKGEAKGEEKRGEEKKAKEARSEWPLEQQANRRAELMVTEKRKSE